MKKTGIILVIIAALATGCTANLKMDNLKIDRSLKPGKEGKAAVISSLNYYSGNSGTFSGNEDEQTRELKKAIANAIYNSGSFEEVAATEDEARGLKNKKNIVYIDMKVYAIENGEFNWWIAWPGVYPMPAYWPIQPKEGAVAVNIEVSASDSGRVLKQFKGYGSDKYDIDLYGFFRTSPIERAAEKAFLGAVDQIQKDLAGFDFKPAKDKRAGSVIGTISTLNGVADIIIQHSEKSAPRMGELIYAYSGDRRIELIAMFPMMTTTKCRIINYADYDLLKKSMEIYK